jgi:rod shape-determining protein MreD
MMRGIFLLLLTAAAVAIEPIVSAEVVHAAIRPDVLLIPLLVAVVAWPGSTTVVWGGLIGLVCDCLAGSSMGPRMAIFSLIAAIGSLAAPRLRSVTGVFLLTFACAAAAETASLVIRFAFEGRPLVAAAAVEIAGPALAAALMISGAWLVARRLSRPFARSRVESERSVSIGWQRSAD